MPTVERPEDDTLLLFAIDRLAFAVPASQVESVVMPPQQLTRPPGSDAGRPGIFRHHERVYTLIELAARLGLEGERPLGRLLLHEHGRQRHALHVDEVIALVRPEQGRWAMLPPYLPRRTFPRGFLYQERIFLYSEPALLLQLEDHGPLRRHLEELRGAEAKADDSPEVQAVEPPAEAVAEKKREAAAAPTTTVAPREEKAKTPAAPRPAPPKATPPKAATRPRTASTPAASGSPRSTVSRTQAPVRATATPAWPERETTASSRPTSIPTPTAATRPTPPTPSPPAVPATAAVPESPPSTVTSQPAAETEQPPEQKSGGGMGLWLLSLLLVIGALVLLYWWSPWQADERRPVRARPTIQPPPAASTAPPATRSPRPAPPLTPEPTTAPAPAERLSPAASAPQESHDEVLQIEREGDQVRLIINRQALKESTNQGAPSAAAPAAPEPARDAEMEAVAETLPVQPAPAAGAETSYRGVADPALLAQWELAFPLPPLPPVEKTGDACFLHTVVRGDTLWDIAARYVGNPWAFRELAHNSNIRNPDLIYPGDHIVVILR